MIAATTAYDALTLREEAGRFKQTFDALLLTYIQEQRRHFAAISTNDNIHSIFSQLEAVCSDGKRLRPFMVAKLYSQANAGAQVTDIQNILLAVELVHLFCLIHDDVMDEAPTRHGVATIQQFIKSSLYDHIPAHHRSSDSQAILVGDIVFNMVFKLLHAPSGLDPVIILAVNTIFHTLIDEVCIGQMLDIDLTTNTNASEAAILEKNRLKTAYYSFLRPLHIGAVIGNRSDLIPFILEFGEAIGLLYQVEDDLLDIVGDPKVTRKPTFQDVTQNQHTVLTAYVRLNSGAAATLLNSKVGYALTEADKEELKAAFIHSGAINHAENLTKEYEERALTAIDRHTLSAEEEKLFISVLHLVSKRST